MIHNDYTLRVLARDVVNPRKRDRRMTRDWKHDEVIKAGRRFIHAPGVRGEFLPHLRPVNDYSPLHATTDASYSDEGALYAAIMEASTEAPADSLGSLLIRYSYAATSLDEVIAVLLARGDVKRDALVAAMSHVEETGDDDNASPLNVAHTATLRSESL